MRILNRVLIAGVVQSIEIGKKVKAVTLAGQFGRLFRVRGKVFPNFWDSVLVQQGQPYLFEGALFGTLDKGKESFAVSLFRATPIEGEIREGPYGPYLLGGINQVTLTGYLGKDPAFRVLEREGRQVRLTTLRLAVKAGASTVWVDAKLWDQVPSLTKGSRVFIQGSYRVERWETPHGPRYRPVVEARLAIPLRKEGKAEGQVPSQAHSDDFEPPDEGELEEFLQSRGL